MAVSRGEIAGNVLRLLMKTASYPGFYTTDLVNDAIQESLDYVATHMFMADEGWLSRMLYFDTVANQESINLPVSAAMIREVRYLFGAIYIPIAYDAGDAARQSSESSGVRQWVGSYRILDNALYFNPPLAEGGEKFLQLEYIDYPKRLQTNTDTIDPQIDRCMQHFIKYRAATVCAAAAEKFNVPWANLEKTWFEQMRDIIVKRNLQSQPIKEFDGY